MWVASGQEAWSGTSRSPSAPDLHPDIDAAYRGKYDRYGPAIVGTVVGSLAHAVTIRLVPRSPG